MHFPVLLKEALDHLDPKAGDTIFDATLGGGGHALEILNKIKPDGRLIAVDRDPEAINRVREAMGDAGGSISYVNDNFRNVTSILKNAGVEALNGALFDLGMSSFQVDEERRGFSFLKEGPLDMRFDPGGDISASDVVNTFRRDELADIIKEYGEERHAKLVARAIHDSRKKKRIETTGELVEIVRRAVGAKYRKQRLHPAARTFQALRIYVNDELGSLEEALGSITEYLKPGARICVISFHSLEDRIVKNFFRDADREGRLKRVTKKPICPTREEIKVNSRSRSAKLRVAERSQ